VVECAGAACYGDPGNFSCTVTGPTNCYALGGFYWAQGETCDGGECYVRPDCFINTDFGQQPYLPVENWDASPVGHERIL